MINTDADLWIDGTLFTYKISDNYQKKSQDIFQLASYYLFNELNRFDIRFFEKHLVITPSASKFITEEDVISCKESLLDIKKVAIYQARYGEIEYCDFSNLSDTVKNEYAEELFVWCIEGNLKSKRTNSKS